MCFGVAASRWTRKALIEAVLPVEAARRAEPVEVPSSSSPHTAHPSTACRSEMKWKRVAVFATLQAQLSVTGKVGFLFVGRYFKTLLR